MTKRQLRLIRKNSWRIRQELDHHHGTDSEYCRVYYPEGGSFIVFRSDFDRAMKF